MKACFTRNSEERSHVRRSLTRRRVNPNGQNGLTGSPCTEGSPPDCDPRHRSPQQHTDHRRSGCPVSPQHVAPPSLRPSQHQPSRSAHAPVRAEAAPRAEAPPTPPSSSSDSTPTGRARLRPACATAAASGCSSRASTTRSSSSTRRGRSSPTWSPPSSTTRTSTQLTLDLDTSATFDDGTALSADLVKQNLDARGNPDLSAYSGFAAGGENEIADVTVVDDDTVTLTFAAPKPGFEANLVMPAGAIVGPTGAADRASLDSDARRLRPARRSTRTPPSRATPTSSSRRRTTRKPPTTPSTRTSSGPSSTRRRA